MVKQQPVAESCKTAVKDWAANKNPTTKKNALAAMALHHRFKEATAGKASNASTLFNELQSKYTRSPASADQLARRKKKNKKSHAKKKEENQAKIQAALLLHTKEGHGLTVAQAQKEAERLLKTHLAALPDITIEKICIGMKNFDSDRCKGYSRKKGWEATGAKGCTYDPITAYHTYNQLTCRRMEDAIMKELEKHYVLHNKRGGGGGPLGIRNGWGAKTVRMADGKPQWLSDPKGYVVYIVFVPAC